MLHAIPPNLAQARLRHQLEVQSLIVEKTISEYSPRPFRVTGGDVQGNCIWYEMPGEGAWEPLALPTRAIERDLARRLGVSAQVSRWQSGLRVAVERPSPPVDLLTLMQQYQIPAMGAVTAVLGLDAAGMPLQLDLARAGHVLLTGGGADAATALLQTIAVSLALANRPGQLQFLIIQNRAESGLLLLDTVEKDFLLRPVVTTAAEAVQALSALATRLDLLPVTVPAAMSSGPRIVVMIDQLEPLLNAAGFAALEPFVRLLGVSPETGASFSLMAGMQQPQNDLLRYCGSRWGTRIVGYVADEAQARAAMGTEQAQAERLSRDGAFLLVRRGEQTAHYFQAASADRYDLSFLARQQDEDRRRNSHTRHSPLAVML